MSRLNPMMLLANLYIFLTALKTFQSLSTEFENFTANKTNQIISKIEYGKHYVTRIFHTPSEYEKTIVNQNNKKRIKVKRIRKVSEPNTESVAVVKRRGRKRITSLNGKNRSIQTQSTLLKILTFRKLKYSICWGRYTPNYKAASPPYPLKFFPDILVHKHNLTKWYDPDHTEWMTLFDIITQRTKWHAQTLRVYPFRDLKTEYIIALPGWPNKLLRNYVSTTKETDPPNWVHRKFWEEEIQVSEGPHRAYRGRFWYDERNISCRHPLLTNTLFPYTGPPKVKYFDCDEQFDEKSFDAYDDSKEYSEELHLAEKFGSNKKDSVSSDAMDEAPNRLLKGREPNSDFSHKELFTVEDLNNPTNLSHQFLAGQKLEEIKARTIFATPLLATVTKKSRIKNRKKINKTLYNNYAGSENMPNIFSGDRDSSEFEYMLPHYMDLDEREDMEARKLRRRKLRTLCCKMISTIKRKLNTIWWKTFWKQTATTPSTIRLGQSTPWYRVMRTFVQSFEYS